MGATGTIRPGYATDPVFTIDECSNVETQIRNIKGSPSAKLFKAKETYLSLTAARLFRLLDLFGEGRKHMGGLM